MDTEPERQTNYQSEDPDILAVLAASEAAMAALLSRDEHAFAATHASDWIINSPANRVINGEQASRAFASGLIDYESFERNVERITKRSAELIVLMGDEIMVPRGRAADAGKLVRRGLRMSGKRLTLIGSS